MAALAASLHAKFGTASAPPTPYEVQCHGLTREHIGDEAFEQEFHRRRLWLKAHCRHYHEVGALRDWTRTDGDSLVGRTYRFECARESVIFKFTFATHL